MAIRNYKKISELEAITSASLSTYVAGVDNGQTVRITLDVLADGVRNTINTIDIQRLNSLEASTGSYLTSLNGTISGSSQLTSSYDTRYVISGSLTQTTWDNISGKPNGLISQSTDLSALNSFTQSQDILNTAFTNGMNARLQTSSFNDFSASVHTQILAATNEQDLSYLVTTSSFNAYTASISTGSLVNRLSSLENNTGSYLISLNGTISSSAQITAFGFVSQSADISALNSFTSSQSILNTAFNNGISARLQTSSFNDFSTSVDSRIIAATNEQSFNGLISGSSQLTSSYDTRYTLSSSYNTDSSSFNSRFNGLVTTGSNTFSGSQVFSGSMTVTSGQVVASLITANTSSLYLISGSNMYVQNNGVVEITGSLKVKGTARFETVGGDEGGEIEFGVPQTNTTLSTSVKADIYQNRFRIFDGNTNGVYIDLSKAPTGALGEITWKASGFVNAGDYVTLGNLKARIPTSGNRSVQVATVSGTYSVYGSGIYSQAGSIAGTTLSSPLSITTTPAYLNASAGFTVAGATDTWIISDTVNFIAWRITIVIGPSFNANLITIERLY